MIRAGTPRLASSVIARACTAAFSALPAGWGRCGPSRRASTVPARAAENSVGGASGPRAGWGPKLPKTHAATQSSPSSQTRSMLPMELRPAAKGWRAGATASIAAFPKERPSRAGVIFFRKAARKGS